MFCIGCKRRVAEEEVYAVTEDEEIVWIHTIHDPDPQGCGPVERGE